MEKKTETLDQQKIRALELVRNGVRRNAENRGWFICLLLEGVADRNGELRTATYALRKYISASLNGCSSLESWLLKFHGVVNKGTANDYTARVYRTRLAWIDWMIAQLRSA